MSEKLRDIRLYGALGAKFGRSFRLAVDSPAEAIRALCVIVPGFKAELLASKSKGVGYSVFTGKRNLGADELDLPPGSESMRIAPFILGAKRGGLFNVLLGAALITAAFFVPQAGLFGVKALSAGAVGLMGASMALGGIVQLLSPQQVGLSVKDSPDNGANYNFNGPVNTQAQGNPVPLLYGRMIIGGAVISAGIYAEDQA